MLILPNYTYNVTRILTSKYGSYKCIFVVLMIRFFLTLDAIDI